MVKFTDTRIFSCDSTPCFDASFTDLKKKLKKLEYAEKIACVILCCRIQNIITALVIICYFLLLIQKWHFTSSTLSPHNSFLFTIFFSFIQHHLVTNSWTNFALLWKILNQHEFFTYRLSLTLSNCKNLFSKFYMNFLMTMMNTNRNCFNFRGSRKRWNYYSNYRLTLKWMYSAEIFTNFRKLI